MKSVTIQMSVHTQTGSDHYLMLYTQNTLCTYTHPHMDANNPYLTTFHLTSTTGKKKAQTSNNVHTHTHTPTHTAGPT